MALAVAYYVPHNEGIESGIITEPGFDSGHTLVDLYEVDATIRSFASEAEAQAWLNTKAKSWDDWSSEAETRAWLETQQEIEDDV